jgi:DNA-directed RNA polymerase specialized sigma24 family protein
LHKLDARLLNSALKMGKVAELTPKKRSVIVALATEKLSYSAIANRVGCSKASVGKTLKLFNETGGVVS